MKPSSKQVLTDTFNYFRCNYDENHGGFNNSSAKFINHVVLRFLLDFHVLQAKGRYNGHIVDNSTLNIEEDSAIISLKIIQDSLMVFKLYKKWLIALENARQWNK